MLCNCPCLINPGNVAFGVIQKASTFCIETFLFIIRFKKASELVFVELIQSLSALKAMTTCETNENPLVQSIQFQKDFSRI